MAEKFIIPHPNIPTADIGLPKLKEVTVKNNENFLALDRLIQEFASNFDAVDEKIESMRHEHPYALIEHTHLLSDVEGLIAALELKAPLIHTHPEYLTEVPVHGHKESEIDGLLADLAGKADIQHKHNIGDVYALRESLNGKASNDYVLWLESQMARVSQDEIPLVDGDPQTGAGVIGTSSHAARADHRHPVNRTTNVGNLAKDGSGEGGTALIGSLLSYAMTDHSHPLNYPSERPSGLIPDGTDANDEKNFAGRFGDVNYYADLGHSHALNIDLSEGFSPSDVSKTEASPGLSKYYAQADHVHKLPELLATDVKYGTNSTVGAKLDNHETRISSLEGSGGGTVKSVLGVQPDSSGNVGTGILGTDASHAAAGNHTHTSSAITDFDTAVKALIDADLTNYAKNDDFAKDDDDCFTEPLAQHAHWADGVIVIQGTSGEVRLDDYFFGDKIDGTKVGNLTAGKWVKTNATTGVLETTDDDPILSDGECDAGELPMMDEDGVLTASGIIAPLLVEKGKVLTADGEGGSSWEDAEAELDQVDDGKVVVGESFKEDGESKIRLTSKSNFAKDIDALLLKTSGQSHKVEIDAQKVRFKEVLGSPDAGDFVCLDANLNLTAVGPDTKLQGYAKSNDLSEVRTIANSASSAAAAAATAASQAKTTAQTAQSTAEAAQSAADEAQATAEAAQSAVNELFTTVGEVQTALGETNTKLDNQITAFSTFQSESFSPLQQLVNEINGDYVTGTEYEAKMALVDDDIGQLKTDMESALTDDDVGVSVAALIDGVVPKTQLPDIELDDLPDEVAYVGGVLSSGKFVAADANGALVTPSDQPIKKSDADGYYASKATENVASGAASAAASAATAASQAQSIAQSAQTTAQSAQTTAQTAQSTANEAKQDVINISEIVSQLQSDVSGLNTQVSTIESEVQQLTSDIQSVSDRVGTIESEYMKESEADIKYVHGAGTTVIGGPISWNGSTITQPIYRLSVSNGQLSLVSAGQQVQINTVTYNP